MSKRRVLRPLAHVPLDLALQGGGSHGAFTWGVLDRLLDDSTLPIAAISGTSAGALNAAVLATGWVDGGRAGAQAALRSFWGDVAARGSPSGGCFGGSTGPSPLKPDLAGYNLDTNPFYAWMAPWLRLFSPYQTSTAGSEALRQVLQRHVKPQHLQRGPIDLFITATAVRTGQPRVFDRHDLTIDALLASACLPTLFRAVEIEGEPYWDGGYSGNPALWPLIYNSRALDVLLVRINPLVRPQRPETADEIADRINEITFNAGLVAEMRAIQFVDKLIEQKRIAADEYKHLRLHVVADDESLAPLRASSKLNTKPDFLLALHALGHAAADRWLSQHRGDVGRRSTIDLRGDFLAARQAPPAAPALRLP
ncbi:MAG: patatin-like phospholipase family protein [Rubrivivax sp.]|nr:patatin-like phospholipase family protein [Rubrivivax sp.]